MTWEVKKLGEVCEIGAGNSAPQDTKMFDNGNYPFFRTSDVGQIHIGFIEDSLDKLNVLGIKKLTLYKKGTLLFPKSGASTFLNHRVVMDVEGYVSSHLATIKANNLILNDRFLFYFSLGVDSRKLMQDQNYPSLRLSDIQEIEIPIPPLLVQKRIVAILDKTFESIKQAKENAEKNLENANEIFESYLQSFFENKGEGWEEKTLMEVCEKITDGTHQTPTYYNDGIIFLSSRNVTSGKINWEKIKYIDKKQHLEMHKRVAPRINDILLAKNGTTGVAAMVDKDITFDIYVSLALLRPLDTLLPSFLLYFINSPSAKKQFNKRLKGMGVPNLHLEEIREVVIPFPKSIKEQQLIVKKFDKLSTQTKQLEAIYEKKLANLEELKKSILQKAFNGELIEVSA